jgi:hypothetical protein
LEDPAKDLVEGVGSFQKRYGRALAKAQELSHLLQPGVVRIQDQTLLQDLDSVPALIAKHMHSSQIEVHIGITELHLHGSLAES